MHHLRGSHKQKRSLNSYHQLARRSFRISSGNTRRFIFRPRVIIAGLTATIGLSSLAVAAAQHDAQVKSQIQVTTESDIELPAIPNASTTDIKVDAFSNTETGQGANETASPNADTQVTINNQIVPLNENGTVHRTVNDENGSMTVDISVDSSSSDTFNHDSSTRIDIDSSSRTRTQTNTENVSRGSP